MVGYNKVRGNGFHADFDNREVMDRVLDVVDKFTFQAGADQAFFIAFQMFTAFKKARAICVEIMNVGNDSLDNIRGIDRIGFYSEITLAGGIIDHWVFKLDLG